MKIRFLLSSIFCIIFFISCGQKSSLNLRFDKIENPKKASELYNFEKLKKETSFPIVGSPEAIKGGSLTLSMGQFPKSLNYYVNNSMLVSYIFGSLYETLLTTHPTTLEPVPALASSWEISKDNTEFTFYLDKDARWNDGVPVTTADILFTYEVIMNPSNLTTAARVSLQNLQAPEIIDDHTFKIKAKKVHWRNFITAYNITILPKHLYEGKDFNKDFTSSLPDGSGPYRIAEIKKDRYIMLGRNKNYWAESKPANFGLNNFDRIKYKIVMERSQNLNHIKKGNIDIHAIYTSKYWINEFNTSEVEKNWLKKVKIYNYEPQGFQGLCFNLRNPLFQDIRIRKAISHLLNQKLLIEKLMFNEYEMQNSFWPHINGGNKNNPYYEYNPIKARALLKEAGWVDTDTDGILIKDGQRLEFTVPYTSKSLERIFTIFIEDFKNVGIKMNLEDFKFDLAWMSWGASIFPEPRQLWHSEEAKKKNSSNYPGYENKKVDELIELYAGTFSIQKRYEILKQIDTLIYADLPYVLLWNTASKRIVFWDKFGYPEHMLGKHGNEYAILTYWWYSPEKAAALQKAFKENISLEKTEILEYYDNSLNNLK